MTNYIFKSTKLFNVLDFFELILVWEFNFLGMFRT